MPVPKSTLFGTPPGVDPNPAEMALKTVPLPDPESSGWPGPLACPGGAAARGTGQGAATGSGRQPPPASCRFATRTGKLSGPPDGADGAKRTHWRSGRSGSCLPCPTPAPNEADRAERSQPRRTKPTAPNEADRAGGPDRLPVRAAQPQEALDWARPDGPVVNHHRPRVASRPGQASGPGHPAS